MTTLGSTFPKRPDFKDAVPQFGFRKYGSLNSGPMTVCLHGCGALPSGKLPWERRMNDSGSGHTARPPTVSITEAGRSPQPWTKPTLRSGITDSVAVSACSPFQNKALVWGTVVHYDNKQVIVSDDCIGSLSLL